MGSSLELRREDRTEDKDSNAFSINVIVKDLNLYPILMEICGDRKSESHSINTEEKKWQATFHTL